MAYAAQRSTPSGHISWLVMGRRTGIVLRPGALVVALAALLSFAHFWAWRHGAHWTSPLLIGDHLFDLLFACAVLWYGLALGRKIGAPLRIPADDRLSEDLAAMGLGLGALSLCILLLGFLRLYYGPIFLIGALALTLWLRTELGGLLDQASGGIGRWIRAGMPSAPTLAQRLLLLLIGLTFIPVLIHGMVPVTAIVPDWDATAYHMAAPKIYVQLHRIVPLPDIPLANAPSGEELFSVLGLLAGTESLGKLLNVLFALLLGLATFAFGRRHFSDAAGLFGVFLLFNLIWVIQIMPATIPDFATALLLLLAVSDCLAWVEQRYSPVTITLPSSSSTPITHTWRTRKSEERLLLRSGLLLGIAVSFKLTTIPAIPALGLTAGLSCLFLPQYGWAMRIAWGIRSGVLVGLAAAAPLSPWLLKNLYFFHNPLYPTAVATSGANTGNGPAILAAHPTLADHISWILTTVGDLFWRFVSPLSIALVLAPFLLRRPAQRAALIFLLIDGILWLLFVPYYLPPRYWLGMVAISEVVIAAVLWEMLAKLPVRRTIAELPLVAYLLIQAILVLTIAWGLADRASAFTLVQGQVSHYDYLATRVRPYLAEDYVNAQTPSNAVIAVVNLTPGYYLDRTYLNDWYGERFAKLESISASRQAELAIWCQRGVHYALFNRGSTAYNDEKADRDAGIRPLESFTWTHQPGLQPHVLYSAHGVDVLAVQPCSVQQTASVGRL